MSVHDAEPILTAGADDPAAAVILLHGRGATPRSAMSIVQQVDRKDVRYLAPSAARNTWYPQSFMAPTDENEPWLSSALSRVGDALDEAAAAGVDPDAVLLAGFSQGACLASEYVARNPRRYGGLAALSGGVIGPEDDPLEYEGDLAGTPAFVGCSDRDPHIPLERVRETTAVLRDLGADVDERIYEGMGHTIDADELDAVAALVDDL
jgi:predicted esterase